MRTAWASGKLYNQEDFDPGENKEDWPKSY